MAATEIVPPEALNQTANTEEAKGKEASAGKLVYYIEYIQMLLRIIKHYYFEKITYKKVENEKREPKFVEFQLCSFKEDIKCAVIISLFLNT